MGTTNLEVLAVSAYYKNDKPGGIGVGLNFVGREGIDFCHELEANLGVYDRLLPLERVLQIVDKFSRDRPDFSDRSSLAIRSGAVMDIVGSIYWLQERGHLAPDEYNGLAFGCFRDGALVVSEVNPVTIDDAMTGLVAVDVTDIFRASKAPALDQGLFASLRAVADHARSGGK